MKGRLVAPLLALAASACLYIPWHRAAPGSRLRPRGDAVALRGVATREEVLLALGEPDWTSADQRVFVYAWQNEWGLVVAATPYGGAGYEFVRGRQHFLVVEFDGTGAVRRSDVKAAFTVPGIREALQEIDGW